MSSPGFLWVWCFFAVMLVVLALLAARVALPWMIRFLEGEPHA